MRKLTVLTLAASFLLSGCLKNQSETETDTYASGTELPSSLLQSVPSETESVPAVTTAETTELIPDETESSSGSEEVSPEQVRQFSEIIPETPSVIDYDAKLAWRVEPMYDRAYFEFWAGVISYGFDAPDDTADLKNYELNIFTGEVKEGFSEFATGGLPPPDEWLYDENKNLFCLHGTNREYMPPEFRTFTPDEFEAFCNDESGEGYFYSGDNFNWLRAFRKIDSEKVTSEDLSEVPDYSEIYYDLSGAYDGDKYALVCGTEFLTDFIYDFDFENSLYANNQRNLIAIKSDGKFGAADKNAKIAVPFVMDGIIFVSEEIAFALYGGKWGVLDLDETSELQE